MPAKILVIGSGGREHALVRKLAESTESAEVFCWPSSAAIARHATLPTAKNISTLVDWAQTTAIDLCIVGDENFLVQGIADALNQRGINCWSAEKSATTIESDKWWAKKFMRRHNIPHAAGEYAASVEATQKIIANFAGKFVLKFTGLAAGKGVLVDTDDNSPASFLDTVFVQKKWGAGGIIVEEKLAGDEVSIFAAVNGTDYQLLPPARDYKALKKHGEVLNTGGMGAVAGEKIINQQTRKEICTKIIEPTLHGLAAENINYRGFLYFGLMLTTDGARVLEYNCRLGDPETQAIMPLIDGDFVAWLLAAAAGKIPPTAQLKISNDFSVSVVMATENYPCKNSHGQLISGLDHAEKTSKVFIDHASTQLSASSSQPEASPIWQAAGGRILTVSCRATSIAAARQEVYAVLDGGLGFAGAVFRRDIGADFFDAWQG